MMNGLYRKITVGDRTFYVSLDHLNAADHVFVDTHDPNSRGFGGSKLSFEHPDGIDEVKGPWHTGENPVGDLNLSYLHLTRVTLYNKLHEPIYTEDKAVLGPFMRGEILAHQLADLRGEAVFVKSESGGGSSSGWAMPGELMHPMAYKELGQPVPSSQTYRDNAQRLREVSEES